MAAASGGHSGFAANLRRLCASATSIADVCRDTGINRQQFNKYLAGRSIPSARVLRKICLRLGVSEDALLGEANTPSTDSTASPDRLVKELDRLFGLFLPGSKPLISSTAMELEAGAYYAYFPFAGFDGYLLRSYMETRWHNDTLFFTRLTSVRNSDGRSGFHVRSRHYGIAIASQKDVTLLARNRQQPFQISAMNLDPARIFGRFHVGLTITRSTDAPIACRVVMEKIGGISNRRIHLSACGVVPLSHETVPPFVQAAMAPDPAHGALLTLPDKDQIIGSIVLGQR